VDNASSWDEYIHKYPKAKPFRNKGWPYFQRIALIVPSKAKGAHVYYPSLAPAISSTPSTPSTTSTISPSFTPTISQPILTTSLGDESDQENVCIIIYICFYCANMFLVNPCAPLFLS
jgi:hypothetical protein